MRDTPFERKQHESTAKHQNNLKKFLRDIQNDHERGERDKQKAKAEVDRLNKITGSGPAFGEAATPSAAPTFTRVQQGQRNADDQKRQWQQLSDMGIQVPDHVRQEMAMASDWKVVAPQRMESPSEDSLSVGVRKRKLEDGEEEDGDQESHPLSKRKIWGKSTKAQEDNDNESLDALLSTKIPLKQDKKDLGVKRESVDTSSAPTASEAPSQNRLATADHVDDQDIVSSEGVESTFLEHAEGKAPRLVKEEAADSASTDIKKLVGADPTPVFKKRKPKASPVR